MKLKGLYTLLALLLIPLAFFLGYKLFSSNELKTGSPEKFEYLVSARTNKCGLLENLDAMNEDDRLQGSCCSTMDLHRYQEQVSGLKKFKAIAQIPQDPYDISVKLAKELFDYQKSIELNESQKGIYEKAISLSHEGGPCCCRCWRWTAFEGLAKYLIAKQNFSAEKIAEVWDLEDGCGGSEHAHS